jgi:hypothetical protein
LREAIEDCVAEHTAGSPVDEHLLWTNRSPRQIAQELKDEGFSICADTVRRILIDELGLSVRQAQKEEAASQFAFRDEQFRHIAGRRHWYQRRGWPVVSIDTKKKELLGDFLSSRSSVYRWHGSRAGSRLCHAGRRPLGPLWRLRCDGERRLLAAQPRTRHQRAGLRRAAQVVGEAGMTAVLERRRFAGAV